MASTTPRGTTMTTVTRPSRRLLRTASWRLSSLATDPASVHHQRTENPCQVERLRPLLNEKAMAISTGTIDHST
jgi:hypothetical protein